MQRSSFPLFALSLALSAGSAFAQTKWDLPAAYAATNFHSENLIQFAKDVETATAGKLVAVQSQRNQTCRARWASANW